MNGSVFGQYIDLLLGQFVDPGKRIYLLYLLSSVIIAVIWLYVRRRTTLPKAWGHIAHRKIWSGRSARSDIYLILINQAISMLLAPVLLGRLAVATGLYYFLTDLSGSLDPLIDCPEVLLTALFTLTYFILDDWSRYRLHRLLHELPALWFFHKVHHSARTMSPLTVYRVHPLEGVLFSLRGALVQGSVTALFVFLFGAQTSLITVLGASVISFMFNIAGSNLRHSHIRIGYWPWLERILISPAQHQLHHSSAVVHFDKNYGSVLALWDYWGGSLTRSAGQSKPRYGLSRRAAPDENTLTALYIKPFMELYSILKPLTAQLFASGLHKVIYRKNRSFRKS